MPRYSPLLLASFLLIDLAVLSLLVVVVVELQFDAGQSAASWLDGPGGMALAPMIILKLSLAGLLFIDSGHLERLSARLTAAAWFWLAIGKALGLHLIIGPVLALHLIVWFPIGGHTAQIVGKFLAMAAIVGLAVALLLSARVTASDRTAALISQLGLAVIAMLGLAALIPELANVGLIAGASLPLAAVELAIELCVTSLLLVGAAATYRPLTKTPELVELWAGDVATAGAR